MKHEARGPASAIGLFLYWITQGTVVVIDPAAVAKHETRFSTFSAASVGVVPVLNGNPPTETASPLESPETPLTFWNCVGVGAPIVCTSIEVAGENSGGKTPLPTTNVGGAALVREAVRK
jgi:hypothetical protein